MKYKRILTLTAGVAVLGLTGGAAILLATTPTYPLATHSPVTPPEPSPSWLTTPEGLRLYQRLDSGTGETRAILWFVEGSEITQGNDYPRLVEQLRREGFDVAHFHARGSGYSDGPRGDADYTEVLSDYHRFADVLLQKAEGLPVFLFGHSAGGALALEVAAARPEAFGGVVLVNPSFRYTASVGPTILDVARFLTSLLFRPRALTVDMNSDPGRIRHPEDRRDAERLQADPLVVRYYSMRHLMGLRGVLARCLENAARLQLPLLLVQGEEDEIIDPRGGEEILAASPSPDRSRLAVEHGGHGAATVEEAAERIVAWLGKRVN
jgi:acylglycerol lipase